MKIILDSDCQITETALAPLVRTRWLTVHVNDKLFYERRSFNHYSYGSLKEEEEKAFQEMIDKLLIGEMEKMLTKFFKEAEALDLAEAPDPAPASSGIVALSGLSSDLSMEKLNDLDPD
jgi:hypothetical protein